MVFSSSFSRITVTFLASVLPLIAQEIPTNTVAKVDSPIPPTSIGSAADGNIMTRRDARTITLKSLPHAAKSLIAKVSHLRRIEVIIKSLASSHLVSPLS